MMDMMDEVEVPTFLCKEEKIVEVMFTRWGEVSMGEWRLMDPSPQVYLNEDVNRVVFELPTGCFDIRTLGFAGGMVSLQPDLSGFGDHPRHCERPHGYEEAMRVRDSEGTGDRAFPARR
jgi:hypothetical protein